MNELIRVENGEVKLDSRMIAEHFNKEHKNVLVDVRGEISSLINAGLSTELIFQPSEYIDSTGRKLPCFEMGEEGAMQLAARYDAVSRRKLILKIKELKYQSRNQVTMDDCFKAADLISKTPSSKLQYVLKILNNHFDLGDLQRMKVNKCKSDEFSKRLAALMKEKGITQRELAEMSGVCKSAISQYCNGVHKPRADNLQMLAEALNVSVYILVETK